LLGIIYWRSMGRDIFPPSPFTAPRVCRKSTAGVRRQLAADGKTLSGLYAGNSQRETARPTAERLLEAFQEVTLTVMEEAHQVYRHLTALSPLQGRILELLGFSSRVYRRLCTVSHEPL
jgi:hypothetical protein